MSKTVTAIAAVFVIVVVAVVAINHGALDLALGEGEADAEFEIKNSTHSDVTVEFSDGINDPVTLEIPKDGTAKVTMHYKWDNKLPMMFTAKCHYEVAGLPYDISDQVSLKSGETKTVEIDLSLVPI